MKFKAFLSGVAIISAILFGVVYSEQNVMAESVVEKSGETTNASNDAEEHTIQICIDQKLVDTLHVKHGDTLTLTNNYKGMCVKEWLYWDSTSEKYIGKRISNIDQNITITITKDGSIRGSSQVPEIPEDVFYFNDKIKDSPTTTDSTSKKKLSSPSLLKCKKGMKKLTIKGKKGSVIVVKVGKKSKTVYMKNKMKKVLVLDKALKKGTKIKIYAKKAGYQKSKIRVYKVR